MKKLFIIMVLALCLCGCSNKATDQPTIEPIQTTAPTEKPKEEPTEPPTSTPTPTETEISDDGFVSAENYAASEEDWEIYKMLYEWLQIAGCDEKVLEDMASLDFTVKIGKDGISFKNIPDSYANALMGFIGDDLDYYHTSQDYYISIKGDGGGWFKATMDKAPKH
jgi:hypothetical protein